MSEFNTRFREIRKSLKLTLREMSQVLSIPLSTVSKYEQGVIKPGVEILSRVCLKYKVNLNWLLTGVGEMFLDGEELSRHNGYVKIKAKRKNGDIQITYVSDKLLFDPSDYKKISNGEYEKLMYKLAEKADRFIITDFTDENNHETSLIYYPDKHSEAVDKEEILKRDKLIDAVKHNIGKIYSEPSKIECLSSILNSLEDQKSFEEIKGVLENLGVSLT